MHAVAEVLLDYDRAKISGCSWDLLGSTLEEWSKNDPLAVKQFLETHHAQDLERYYPKLVRNWAAYDPEAARAWVTEITDNHPPPPEGDADLGDGWTATAAGMLSGWLEGFLENEPEAAIHYILEHPSNEVVSEALRPVAGNLFIMSPDRARDFVRQLAEEQRATSLSGIADQANRFVRSDAADPTTSPRFVAEWMRRAFPEQWERQLGAVLLEWKYGNPPELLAWMAELPAGERETAVRRFPTFVSDEKPSEDFDLIMQADDLVLRDQLLERLAKGTHFHGEALVRVIQTSKLPPAHKLHLASLIPPPPDYGAAPSDSSTE
jgi:hypothetical protein